MAFEEKDFRSNLETAKRVVLKVGTRVLVPTHGKPDGKRMGVLVRQILKLRSEGKEVILVSSGAVGAGLDALGTRRRPNNLPDLQMAAAVGQSRLMAQYDKLFGAKKVRVAQLLLTHEDLKDRVRHLNVRNTIMNLLRNGVVPIINENDVVVVDEIKLGGNTFGDNDALAALVTLLVQADALVLLSTVNGLRLRASNGKTKRISFVPHIDKKTYEMVYDGKGGISRGGMKTKLDAAKTVTEVGAHALILDGRKDSVIQDAFSGGDVGTYFLPLLKGKGVSGRKRWIAFFQRASGSLVVDEGAARAILKQGKSLLPVGVKAVEGSFGVGALVSIVDVSREIIARGLVEYGSDDIEKIRGKKTSQIASLLGGKPYDEIIHRDNMVITEE